LSGCWLFTACAVALCVVGYRRQKTTRRRRSAASLLHRRSDEVKFVDRRRQHYRDCCRRSLSFLTLEMSPCMGCRSRASQYSPGNRVDEGLRGRTTCTIVMLALRRIECGSLVVTIFGNTGSCSCSGKHQKAQKHFREDAILQGLQPPRLDFVGSFRGASPSHTILLSNVPGRDELQSRNDCLGIDRRTHDRALRARSKEPGGQQVESM